MTKNGEKRTTIKDVARAAGTSVATVSRVLSNADYPVSAQLREKVRTAAEELGFVPNELAKSMKSGNFDDVAVVIPNMTNQFYLQALVSISKIANQKHYNLILCNTNMSVDEEHRCLAEMFKRRVKGIIVSSLDRSPETIKRYIDQGMHFVLLDQHFEGVTCPSIKFDSRAGAKIATEHLIDNGHNRIAFVSAPITRWSREELLKGYKEALDARGLPFDDSLLFVPEPDFQMEDGNYELGLGRLLAGEFLKKRRGVTAVLCNNDMVAISFIQALEAHGIAVPEDVSVMGFDNIPLAEYIQPGLSTISYPSEETGSLAMMMLHNNIRHKQEFTNLDISLVPRIVSRETVKKL